MWLRYKMAGDTLWTQRRFEPLDERRAQNIERLSGMTLRRYPYSKVVARRWVHTITISADEMLRTGAQDFMNAFMGADLLQVSFLLAPAAGNDAHGAFVTIDGGDEPVNFLDGYTALREYVLRLAEEDPF